MKAINVGKSKVFLESLNESSAKKCKSFRNKNIIFRGKSNSVAYGSVMCSVAMLNGIDEIFWLEHLSALQKNFADDGGYFAIWSYWQRPDQCFFMGSISKDSEELEVFANSILVATGLCKYLNTKPQISSMDRGMVIENGNLRVADSVRVTRLVL